MAEQLDLPTPFGPTTTYWQIFAIHIKRGLNGGTINPASSFIEVCLFGDNGQLLRHRWSGTTADDDIVALNKANLSTNSLNRRLLAKLIADGIITGTISGTAD